jgi:hypothetical protein
MCESASRSQFSAFTRLVTLLEFGYFSVLVSNVLVLTAFCKLIDFVFKIFPNFSLKLLLASRLSLLRLSSFIWFGFCSHDNFDCLL